ncbi:MAG: hypothetical protein D3924_19775 [Candidatus Electrothrix sp. AR4]|nr:hypothetical protein [Candidatus Electrothrix sp. AR4]
MNTARKPILVTGSHRSGTTWTGKNLAQAPHTGYIHEPFNIDAKFGVVENPFNNWFQYICDENSAEFIEVLRRVIQYGYPLRRNLARAKTVQMVNKIAKCQMLSLLHKIKNDPPIVKDPIAIFSADWLSKTFDMDVIVLIRHPAAFCSSLKKKNWLFDFDHFIKQPLLMHKYLNIFEKKIHSCMKNKKDIIDQGILLWNCIYHTVNIYQQDHPEWLFVRHEDLSSKPVDQFRSIYETFNLKFTSKVNSIIIKNSGAHNPTEQQPGNEFIRNSNENIYNWKRRLTQGEIERIKENTFEISKLFYTENEW